MIPAELMGRLLKKIVDEFGCREHVTSFAYDKNLDDEDLATLFRFYCGESWEGEA